MLEDVQSEQDLGALPLLLNAVEGALQVQPEADLLQGGSRGGVSVQFSHLRTQQSKPETTAQHDKPRSITFSVTVKGRLTKITRSRVILSFFEIFNEI